jgi:hypothetical protein
MKNLILTLALLISAVSFGQTSTEYFNSGNDKAEANDHYGAISDFTKAIELNPNYTKAYYNRGNSKEIIGDLTGACEDWKKAAALGHIYNMKWVEEKERVMRQGKVRC